MGGHKQQLAMMLPPTLKFSINKSVPMAEGRRLFPSNSKSNQKALTKTT
jgi:hypothetical protein